MAKEIEKIFTAISTLRTNEFFESLAITSVKIGFEIKRYLDPDILSSSGVKGPTYVPVPNNEILKLMLTNEIEKAATLLISDMRDYGKIPDMNSAHWYESLIRNAELYISHWLPIYWKNKATAKDHKRKELLDELKKLDNE